jgi:hypothetical protein
MFSPLFPSSQKVLIRMIERKTAMFWTVNALLVVFSAALAGKVLRRRHPEWTLFGKSDENSPLA